MDNHDASRTNMNTHSDANFQMVNDDSKEVFVPLEKRNTSNSEEDPFLPNASKVIECPPTIDLYQKSQTDNGKVIRPSMTELIHGRQNDEILENFEEKNVKIIRAQLKPSKTPSENSEEGHQIPIIKNEPKVETKKFGWIEGVFVRCCSNTFGVMLYLRMAWVAGQAGIMMGTMIVLLGALITIITALSMSAICTNGLVKGGGAYYLISRSLGPQFGGAIGVIFSLANVVGAAMYIVGFAETIVQLLGTFGIQMIDGGINDVRIIGILTCMLLLAIIFIGLGFEAKMQIVLLVIIVASIINFYIGCLFSPTDEQKLKGMTGFQTKTFIENFYPSFRNNYNFASVFAIYFPAATGIMAGANISGDLKNSATAIPKGTILAIFLSTLVYISIVWISGSTVIRDADGITFPNFLETQTAISNDGWWISSIFSTVFGNGTQYYSKPTCAFSNEETCKYGIMNDSKVFNLIAYWSPLVTAGVLTSTLSSALLSLVSGPKIFQAVAQDNIFPHIGYFSTGFRKNREPHKAYILAFIIAALVVLVGNLNAIALIISNFYLSTYTLINFACFDTSFAKSPGFRPSFKFYHQWVSLIGAILCVCVMFIISYMNALITFLFFGLLFFYMAHRKPNVNWGSSKQAHAYRHAFQYVQRLEKINEHVKNYRPQILVLSGNPAARPGLVDFAHAITKGNSLLVCGHVIPHNMSGNLNSLVYNLTEQIKSWFNFRHLKAFYFAAANSKFQQGIQCLLQGSGLGKLKPNILLIGFKQDWNSKGINGLDEVNDYINVIIDAFDSKMGVCVLRNGKDGFDLSDVMLKKDLPFIQEAEKCVKKKNGLNTKVQKIVQRCTKPSVTSINLEMGEKQSIQSQKPSIIDSLDAASDQLENHNETLKVLSEKFSSDQVEILTSVNRFHFKVEKGVIDIWWIYDDGGLSLLIPYLLTKSKSYLEGSKLRIFTLANISEIIKEEEQKLAAMLSKFRIKYSEIIVIKEDGKNPNPETIQEFKEIINPFCAENSEPQDGMIYESELKSNEEKTFKILKLVEHLQTFSAHSNLVVITLPVPRIGAISSSLYMAWMEIMSRNQIATLFIRGNQTSVLTLYS